MLNRFALTTWVVRAGIVLACVTTFAVACVTEERPRPTCNELADGGTAIELPEALVYQGIPVTDAQALHAFAAPGESERLVDPGPACTDCQQAADVDVLLIHDFEQAFAPTWFNYGEPGVPIQPPQVGFGATNDAGVPPPYWGLQVPALAEMPGGERCGSKYALHLAGGPFLSWGGGYVSRFVTVRGPDAINKYCPTELPEGQSGIGIAPSAINGSCGFWITPVATQGSRLGINASEYEGISFWARRSPGAQSTLRVALNDQNTAEGLALQVERKNYQDREIDPRAAIQEPACKRTIECCRHCRETDRDALILLNDVITGVRRVTEKRCRLADERPPPDLRMNESGDAEFRAYAPETPGVVPVTWIAGPWQPAGTFASGLYRTAYDEWDRDFKRCCPPTMEEAEAPNSLLEGLGDPQFGGRECRPYVFNFDYSSGYYCSSPGDPPLPEKNENRCGDAFESTLAVDTEWRFYKIPWSELRRFTPNRKPIDTTGIWSVALFFGQGYLDTYVDDIGFYRKRR